MSITVLLEASPRRASDGVVQTLRMVWNARRRADFFNQQWLPVLHLPPSFETDIGFDGTNFGQGALPNIGTMQIILDKVTAAWPALIWKNAALTIKAAPWPRGGLPVDAADGDFAVVANAKAASISAADSLLTLVVLDAGEVLRRPVQPVLFGTSGVVLLDGADAKDHFGSPVPVGWGVLSKVRGKLVDRTNLIYCFLGRAATAVAGFYDGGAPFTLGVARANLAALQATAPAAGAVDYCLNAAGLVLARPWAKPVYPFTADLTAGSTQAADIANSIVTSRTALTFGAGVVAAFNGIQAAPCGRYVDDSSTIAEQLDRLFAGLGSFWRLTRTGTLDIKRIGFAGVAAVSFGSWQVAKIERRGTILPTGRRTLGYAHNNTVHGENDIAKLLTENLAYADGTAIDALKPAVGGATRNANRGVWSAASVAYVIGDETLNQSSTWTALVAHVSTGANGPPVLPTTGNAHWQLRAKVGDDGAAGLDTLNVTASPTAMTVACSPVGAPNAGQLPRTVTIKVRLGGTDVTGSCTITNTGTGCTITDSGSTYTVDAIAGDTAKVATAVTYGALAGAVTTQISKTRDGSPAVSVQSSFSPTGSGSFVSAGTLTLAVGVAGSGGTITLDASLDYDVASGFYTAAGKWQYRATPGSGTWIDVAGAETVGSTADATVGGGGSLFVGDTMTGPTTPTNWEFNFLRRRYSGGTSPFGTGTMQVSFAP